MYCIVIDPKELKRQRDRERYSQNKDEINKRRREAYKHKKDAATNATQTPLTASPGNDDHLRHNRVCCHGEFLNVRTQEQENFQNREVKQFTRTTYLNSKLQLNTKEMCAALDKKIQVDASIRNNIDNKIQKARKM